MIIKLPHVKRIDTLNLPENFEDIVKESFEKFTKGTSRDYTFEDKLMYLDNIRKYYIGSENAEDAVMELIDDAVHYTIENDDTLPDREDVYCFEFMTACYEKGLRPYRQQYENSSSRNTQTLKVILEIIRIVVEWSDSK